MQFIISKILLAPNMAILIYGFFSPISVDFHMANISYGLSSSNSCRPPHGMNIGSNLCWPCGGLQKLMKIDHNLCWPYGGLQEFDKDRP
jgi:hypothetical protein